jgi:transcriptional regulator with XRE-family HTH domain
MFDGCCNSKGLDMVYGFKQKPVIVTYLKEWRVYAGLTQADLAAQMEMSAAQVSRLESGARSPDLLFLYRFKQIVGCSHLADPLVNAPDPTNILNDAELRGRYAELLRVVQYRLEAKAVSAVKKT